MPHRAPAWLWLLLLLAALGGLWALQDRPPRMPGDADHRVDQPEASCLSCHGYGHRHPRPADHPLRDDCFSCHQDATGKLHPRKGAPTAIPGGWQDDPRLAATAR